MCVIWYYIPTRAGVNTARGGEGRDLDTFTDRLRFLHIDIVYPYIPYIPYIYPHNVSQIPKSTQESKTHKIKILKRPKILGIDKIYTYIKAINQYLIDYFCKYVKKNHKHTIFTYSWIYYNCFRRIIWNN
jgi:hypothetical protein